MKDYGIRLNRDQFFADKHNYSMITMDGIFGIQLPCLVNEKKYTDNVKAQKLAQKYNETVYTLHALFERAQQMREELEQSEENKQRALDLLNRQYAEAVKQQDTIIVQLERDKERYWQIIEGALNGKLDNCGVKEK